MIRYQVRKIDFGKSVVDWISARHYSGTCPWSTQHAFGLFDDELMIGVCVFGNFTRKQSADRYTGCLELTRLFVEDGTPKNTESFFIGWCLRWLRRHTKLKGVVSYADPTVGHQGIVYRASNFTQIGMTSASYHYVNGLGVRVHKRQVWQRAKAVGVSEVTQAQAESLEKKEELPKFIYAFEFKKGVIEAFGMDGAVIRKTSKAVEVHRFEPPNDFSSSEHTCVKIGSRIFLVDRCDLPFILNTRWATDSDYMVAVIQPSGIRQSYHRQIVPTGPGMIVDHKNRRKWDNRRCNLHEVHPSQNNHNSTRKNSTGFRGVKYREKTKKYEASFSFQRLTKFLGVFDKAEEAAKAYDLAAVECYGSGAYTNFPIEGYSIPLRPKVMDAPVSAVIRNVTKKPCKEQPCPFAGKGAHGLCDRHRMRQTRHEAAIASGQEVRKYAPRVTVKSPHCLTCGGTVFARNLCERHWRELRKTEVSGRPRSAKPRCHCGRHGTDRQGPGVWLCRAHHNEKHGIVRKRTGRPPKTLPV